MIALILREAQALEHLRLSVSFDYPMEPSI
jgi:hypothetical protein